VRVPRWLPAAAVVLLAAALAWLNRGERVALNLGFATFYRAPLTIILFLAFLAGMLAMLWLGLRQDRWMREELRARGILDIPRRPPAPVPAPAAPAWTQPDETVVRQDPSPEWRKEETAALEDPAPEWRRAEESAARQEPAPAEDRTVIHPRYDEDPAA
jgi:uncharacterized integral membrane protein